MKNGEDMEQPECSYVAGRRVKWYSHFENLLGGCLLNWNMT